jgi:hypothetical protein
VVVCELLKTGDQVPKTPFSDCKGNSIDSAPSQISAGKSKLGLIISFTLIENDYSSQFKKSRE